MDDARPTSGEPAAEQSTGTPRRWRPLPALDRRVAGVLVEKAKTTPDAYPMSVNALVAGCNQKSNRAPLMNVEPDDVEEALERLRHAGAAAEVQGGGRVPRYRHYMYEWLGVDKTEMAVMTELLLRGPQTEGELRGRAARMEPIADLAALRPVLHSLKAKGLVISLTGEGRGHVVTHALYEPREMEKLRAQHAAGTVLPPAAEGDLAEEAPASPPAGVVAASPPRTSAASSAAEVAELRSELAQLREELSELASRLSDCRSDIDHLKQQLGV